MNPLIFELDQRPIPAAALRDKRACELLRVWIAEKGLHCSMRVGREREVTSTSEETVWGVILAEAVRHLARALQREGEDVAASIAAIRGAFDNELDFASVPKAGELPMRH